MSRLVLDTNSLIQCVSRRSRYHQLCRSFLDGRNRLCVSTEILNEYVEVLDVITNNPYTEFINPWYRFNAIKSDPDDNKFVDCAIAANAKFIVTEDRHYEELKDLDFPKVETIKLDEAMFVLL